MIRHDHIPVQLLQPPARLKAVALDLAIRGHKVGYLPGAGDSVAECLEAMGYAVTRLTGADLTPDGLRGLDAVVIGVRAFNVRTTSRRAFRRSSPMPRQAAPSWCNTTGPMARRRARSPRTKLQISQSRVTDENATVTFLAPDHPVLNSPNKISSADFEGWVQERGIYFPDQWDQHFTPILAFNDPGEAPLKGGLLVAGHGRGHFVYTGLVFFRELPAGVPGAYRLFANLVSLGK